MKIYYTGQVGGPFGWGRFGENVTAELDRRGVLARSPNDVDVVFSPLLNNNLDASTKLRGSINIGLTFFELPLGPGAVENAKKYDVVFCGSTWCLERMQEIGITNGRVLIQGVDTDVFKPVERKPDGQFRIFSGGKFEYRKGQDLVIAAFKEFAKVHPEAHLVCSWFNPWADLFHSMQESKHIKYLMGSLLAGRFGDQEEYFSAVLEQNGVSPNQFTVLAPMEHADLAREMANTDCGVFPNRCEGGTNLVMMEYAACGGKVIANTLTGHADVKGLIDYPLAATEDQIRWAEQTVDNIKMWLDIAYLDGVSVAKQPKHIPTWQECVDTITLAITEIMDKK